MLLGNCVLFSLLFSFLVPVAYWLVIKPFHATDLFWYPLKTSENQRGYQKRSVAGNGLMKKKWVIQNKLANKKLNAKLFFVEYFFCVHQFLVIRDFEYLRDCPWKKHFFSPNFVFVYLLVSRSWLFCFSFTHIFVIYAVVDKLFRRNMFLILRKVQFYTCIPQPALKCSKLKIETLEWRQWRRSAIFIINFEHISHLVLVFLLLNWSR